MKKSLALAAVLVGTVTVGGCGGDSGLDYCTEYEENFATVSDDEQTKVAEGQEVLNRFAKDAPEEVRAEWKVLDDFYSSILKIYKDAGIDADKITSGDTTGLDPEKVAEVQTAIGEVAQEKQADLTEATEAINEHADKECDLGESGSDE